METYYIFEASYKEYIKFFCNLFKIGCHTGDRNYSRHFTQSFQLKWSKFSKSLLKRVFFWLCQWEEILWNELFLHQWLSCSYLSTQVLGQEYIRLTQIWYPHRFLQANSVAVLHLGVSESRGNFWDWNYWKPCIFPPAAPL